MHVRCIILRYSCIVGYGGLGQGGYLAPLGLEVLGPKDRRVKEPFYGPILA